MASNSESRIIQTVVDSFVDSLQGRYQKFVSDQFLKSLLSQLIAENSDNWAEYRYYNSGALVFESILELKCKAGGNGHHVAQDLARHYTNYIKEAENPKIDA